jgi:S-DNA-T family DNA segregation ATPase FtsK/SpoIIIE
MIFKLPGGVPVGWAICILLLLITLPASLNLTLTGLLRAVNNHREELRRQEKQESYREPAEVLVERVVQHKQNREIRRQNRSRFEYDLPVDDPDAPRPTPGKKTGREEPEAPAEPAVTPSAPKTPKPKKNSPFDLPVDDPIFEEVPRTAPVQLPLQPAEKPKTSPASGKAQTPAPEPETIALDLPLPEIQPPPSEKIKPSEARKAAAEIGWQIDNRSESEHPAYVFPGTELLDLVSADTVDASAEMRENTRRLQEKLACFNIDAQIVNVTRGPNVTMYELQLAQGVRLNKLTGLSDDIALELGASGVRISAIPDKNSMVGIEVPNKQVSMVSIREILESKEFQTAKSKISFAVGKDINGNAVVGDISKMPHVLIAGTTGSGKSVCTNSILISLLYKATPDEVKLIVVDPKMVEFGIYNGIPHLLIPVVTDAKKAAGALQWAVSEMMRRYRTLSEAGVRDIESYNKAAATDESLEPMPKLVVVIDELADLMMVAGKEVEEAICRIAQMGRASGVHLVIATQRPSADVITGLMKANIPSRIALVVSSAMESRIILDATGAEKLIGKGDMLYAPLGKGKKRVQGCYIDESEVARVIDFVKSNGSADYNDEVQQEIEQRAAQSGKSGGGAGSSSPGLSAGAAEEEEGDELLPAAVDVFLESGMASVSLLQRRLKLGYARAARIVDEMAERGLVGPFEGSKPRALLVTKEQWAAMQNGQSLPAGEGKTAAPVEDLIE